MLYPLLRRVLFVAPPETAHSLALLAARGLGRLAAASGTPPAAPGALAEPVTLMGLRFANRVGLAAGFDKNAVAIDGMFALGFGHVEVGTVTPRPQGGNPQPRLFRVPGRSALINRMGFPNEGAAAVVARIGARRSTGILGVNIGKNATTPVERAVDDYVACLRTVYPVSDYITVNVSSPNTVGLRSLQATQYLGPLLGALLDEAHRLGTAQSRTVPLLVKLAPDLADDELRDTAAMLRSLPLGGVIATNTTLSHAGLEALPHGKETGGVSGAPLRPRSLQVVRTLRQELGAAMTLVGVGGVMSAADAQAMRAAGADLVQVYTGLIYRGPGLARELVDASK
jgi:dihydroorotate dehydrogenase